MATGITLHVDGSRVLSSSRKTQALGWAAVACYRDELVEVHDAVTAPAHRGIGGYHEHVAFVNGVLLVQQLGIAMKDVTLLCDDEIFGYAPTWLHPQNYLAGRRNMLLHRLDVTIKEFFEPKVKTLVLQAFEQARILKVKGHSYHVYQERADYLAKHSARAACGLAELSPEAYDDWIHRGWLRYTSPDESPVRVYAPFTGPAEISAT